MTRARRRVIYAMLRYLREYDDLPGRELSKRLAATTAALLAREIAAERPCRLTLRELAALPSMSCPQG